MKDDSVYLHHILDSIASIESYTIDGKETFFRTPMIRDAAVRNFEIIGEAVRNISLTLKDQNLQIDWKEITRMRNKLIHEYFGVNMVLVWDAVENDLPRLKSQLVDILNRLENPLPGGNHAQGED
jgi:uncharacterized protein with HEPN domain